MSTDPARPFAIEETSESQSDARCKPRKKSIVVCCDGTGNDFSAPNPGPDKRDGQNSNVVKLYTALDVDNFQVAYYHPGVGTMGAPTAQHTWTKQWTKFKGLAFGAGFRDNVLDAYRYLMETYDDNGGDGNGDDVYIFGFSRGAYTARALAGLLQGYGLLCRGNEGHLPYAWRMYVEQHDNREQHTVHTNESFRKTFSHKEFKIHFIGVWDTVSSVGWIYSPLRLFNVATNKLIVTGRHAVSIDEHRCFFMNNLWSFKKVPGQDLLQVWFPGVHSDVGGSYLQPESYLANTTLHWMLLEAEAKGLRLNAERRKLIFGEVPVPHGLEDIWYEAPEEFFEKKSRFRKIAGWKHESLSLSWFLLELFPHIYYDEDHKLEYRRLPLGLRRRQLPYGSLVHPSVRACLQDAKREYYPRNLRKSDLYDADDAPTGADGSRYLKYHPQKAKSSKLLLALDRCILTPIGWAFLGFFATAIIMGFVLLASIIGKALFWLAPYVVRNIGTVGHAAWISIAVLFAGVLLVKVLQIIQTATAKKKA